MATVTATFVNVMTRAAGLTLSKEGNLLHGDTIIHRLRKTSDDAILDQDYFDALDSIRRFHGDDLSLMRTYSALIKMDDLGVLGLAIKTAPDLRAALSVIQRYFALVTDNVAYRFEETETQASLSIEEQIGVHPALQFRNECALASFAHNMRNLTQDELQFDHVAFRHPCHGKPAAYADLFGCEVRFDAGRDALVMPLAALDQPIRLGDNAVSSFLVTHLDEQIDQLQRTPSLVKELLQRVTKVLHHGLPQASEIAAAMGMSERTLYRRLAEEGLTYREILQQAQTQLAHELLTSSDRPIAEIAFLTGFAEQSAFSRAFKRWVGRAPAQYRQEMGNM
ncbi:AraC family transcriptional regulator ligand-binding domain-containing protein [Phaeobacter sp. QD34_3]|uniref:AraC family transcriptional regulator n=1 Tax=unclassified Phaeobacter TaxID=2621772 RepID=UPI00237EF80B|nr:MULTISPECIES: AraC family transcriptional regulator [unclassified Phaeobacter]MDE4133878.1 AraC family transcriptional regulator ligand-binding domain-containing protein [Phaeobacter sp. QD34_3]MDE4137431.1 AraC family transcriptional regulator ligand-binding domain-containing protein [Phaeobacter sp. QD34_24]